MKSGKERPNEYICEVHQRGESDEIEGEDESTESNDDLLWNRVRQRSAQKGEGGKKHTNFGKLPSRRCHSNLHFPPSLRTHR